MAFLMAAACKETNYEVQKFVSVDYIPAKPYARSKFNVWFLTCLAESNTFLGHEKTTLN